VGVVLKWRLVRSLNKTLRQKSAAPFFRGGGIQWMCREFRLPFGKLAS